MNYFNFLCLKKRRTQLWYQNIWLHFFCLIFLLNSYQSNAQCSVVTANFHEGFETTPIGNVLGTPTYPTCWTYLSNIPPNTFALGYTDQLDPNTGTKSFFAIRVTSTASNGDLLLVSPQTVNLGNGTKQVRFFAKKQENSHQPKFEVYSLDGPTLTANRTLIQRVDLTTTWQEYIVALPVTTDDYFAFSFDRDPGTSAYTYLDDIYYEDLTTCLFPSKLAVDSSTITTTSAVVSWTPLANSQATSYGYEVRTSGAPGSGSNGLVTSGTTSATSLSLNGLTGGMNYKVYVRSICVATNGIWTTFPSSFYTLCDVFTGNFYEDFETTPEGTTSNNNYPYCWNYVDEIVTVGYGFVNAVNAQSGTNSYRLYRTNTVANQNQNLILLSPETNNLGNGNGNKQVRFSARTLTVTAPHIIEVVMGDSPTANGNFTVLKTIDIDHITYKEYTVVLPETTNDYFGFRLKYNGTTTASSVFLDDIYYEDAPLCKLIETVSIDNVFKNSAEISWIDDFNDNVPYEVEVRQSGNPGDSGATFTGTTLPGVKQITVTGLNPVNKYTVYVRAVCSTTEKGAWSNGDNLFTLCNYPELISASPVLVCGAGLANLNASFSLGEVRWYDAEEGGNLLHTGSNYTPQVSNDTVFWVKSVESENIITGAAKPSPVKITGTTTSNYGLLFDAYENFVLKSVDVYITDAASTDLTINLTDAKRKVLNTITVTVPAGNTAVPVKHTVNLNWYITGGETYKILAPSGPRLVRETLETGFPYPIGSVGSITNGFTTTTAATYHYFYNWEVEQICETEMVEVPVTVEPLPAFEVSADKVTSCEGGLSELVTITTNLGNYDTFVWTPSAGVTGDAATGWTFSSPHEQLYTLEAGYTGGSCKHIKTVNVFAGSKPELNPNLSLVNNVCTNTVTELKVLNSLPSSISIGSKTTVTAATSEVSAFVQSSKYSKQQYIYSAAELIAQGVDGSGYITELAFETTNSGASFTNANYKIRMMPVADTSFATNNFYTGNFTTVYHNVNHTHSFQGIQNIVFDHPFYWDGKSNIIVEISQEGMGNGSNNAQTYYTAVSGNQVGLHAGNATNADPVSGTRTNNRLDIRFSFEQSTAKWSPASNLYTDAAATIPYISGTNATTVYAILSTPGSYVYASFVEGVNGCSTNQDYTINVADVGLPVVQDQIFCKATPVTDIVVSGKQGAKVSIYVDPNASNPLSTITKTGRYYAEFMVGTCKSVKVPFSITIVDLALPTAQFTQTVCSNGTIADLSAQGIGGSQIKWYSSATETTELQSSHALTNNTVYYASQAYLSCESGRVAVLVTVNQPPAALVKQTVSICGSVTYGSINLNQISGAALVWYPSLTSQTPIPNNLAAVNGTYYVAQKMNDCESTREEITISLQTGNVPLPVTTSIQNICGSGTVAQLTVQTVKDGTALWFANAASTTPLQPTDALVNGTYYVAQQLGNCMSAKIAVAVRVTNISAPAVSSFNVCEGAIVADLYIPASTGTTYKWYINNTSTTELNPNDVLKSGWYFVSREENGCISNKTMVQITVNQRPNSPVGNTQQSFVDAAEISNLVMNEPNVVWYATYHDAMVDNNKLAGNMPLVNGTTYYGVIIGSNGCPSLPTTVSVNITLGTNDFDLANLNYYPNPVQDLLTITYSEEITNVQVFDLNGRILINQKFNKKTISLDFSSLKSGMYILNLKTKNSSQSVKVTKR